MTAPRFVAATDRAPARDVAARLRAAVDAAAGPVAATAHAVPVIGDG
ncbi:MAG: hypothetical protein ACO1PW_07100 [Actinomycetota bacterium]